MSRMIKYADLREEIEMENIMAVFTNTEEYLRIKLHPEEIKKELGCKH